MICRNLVDRADWMSFFVYPILWWYSRMLLSNITRKRICTVGWTSHCSRFRTEAGKKAYTQLEGQFLSFFFLHLFWNTEIIRYKITYGHSVLSTARNVCTCRNDYYSTPSPIFGVVCTSDLVLFYSRFFICFFYIYWRTLSRNVLGRGSNFRHGHDVLRSVFSTLTRAQFRRCWS